MNQKLPIAQGPSTRAVKTVIGPGSPIAFHASQAQQVYNAQPWFWRQFNSPKTMTDYMTQSQLQKEMQKTGNPEIKSPELGNELGQLSDIVQGRSMGWAPDTAEIRRRGNEEMLQRFREMAGTNGDDSADLPSRPTGPIQENNPMADEMKNSPLQQLNFMDPRYRNEAWF